MLDEAGGTFGDVVKLTVYLTDISRLPEYGRIKAEYIRGQQPASTAVGVTALAVPGLMIEVEATAVLYRNVRGGGLHPGFRTEPVIASGSAPSSPPTV